MKMKTFIFLSFVVMAAAYTDVNDNEDVNAVVSNLSELKKHIGCYLDKAPCSKDTLMYKKHMREAVDDGCRECNNAEKHLYKLFLKGFKEHFPDDYKEYQKKYDPTGTHFDTLLADIQNF